VDSKNLPISGTFIRRTLAGRLPIRQAFRYFRGGDLGDLFLITPSRVRLILEGKNLQRFRSKTNGRLIVSGHEYLPHLMPIEQHVPHPTIRELWIEKRGYHETEQYLSMMQAIEAYQSGECDNPSRMGAYWCRTPDDVERYFEILIQAHDDIRKNGYKAQDHLREGKSSRDHKTGDEMKILIDGEGNPVFHASGANHRFSICRLLDIPHVPCRVVAIDNNWLMSKMGRPPAGFERRSGIIRKIIESNLCRLDA